MESKNKLKETREWTKQRKRIDRRMNDYIYECMMEKGTNWHICLVVSNSAERESIINSLIVWVLTVIKVVCSSLAMHLY